MTNGTITVRNSYNPDGARIAKIVNRSNGSETHRYTYNGGKLVYDIIRINKEGTISNLTILMSYDESGRPFMITYANVSYYYLLNAQGDVVGIMNVSGDIMVEYTYDAWGNVLSITGPMADTMGQYNQLRYRGYVYDPETNLYFLNSRFYDPETGRFINADALASTGGLLGNNMFAYCANSPTNYSDHSGHAPSTAVFPVCIGGNGYRLVSGSSDGDPKSDDLLKAVSNIYVPNIHSTLFIHVEYDGVYSHTDDESLSFVATLLSIGASFAGTKYLIPCKVVSKILQVGGYVSTAYSALQLIPSKTLAEMDYRQYKVTLSWTERTYVTGCPNVFYQTEYQVEMRFIWNNSRFNNQYWHLLDSKWDEIYSYSE